MKGIKAELNEEEGKLDLEIQVEELGKKFDGDALLKFINKSNKSGLQLVENCVEITLQQIEEKRKDIAAQGDSEELSAPIHISVAKAEDAILVFSIADDEMSATLNITSAAGGQTPSLDDVLAEAGKERIIKGVSKKRIAALLEQAKNGKPGSVYEDIIAKGLPARDGSDSRMEMLFDCPLDRILKPQKTEGGKVNMRELGEIVLIEEGQPLLRVHPPKPGRPGYSVCKRTLEPNSGNWAEPKLGEGVQFNDNDDRLIEATMSGLPSFKNDLISVDQTFVSNGCNVGTGNIKYKGAVVIEGDVAESMRVEATGDITINGIVEAAEIICGGDLVVTGGTTGRFDEETSQHSAKIVAKGSVHLEHGHGVSVDCQGDISIGKQIAHSSLTCHGNITAGPADNPNGKIVASRLSCMGRVRAGSLGAVSGSKLQIDFSPGLEMYISQKEQLQKLAEQLQVTLNDNRSKVDLIQSKVIPPELQQAVDELIKTYESQQKNLELMTQKIEIMDKLQDTYRDKIGIEVFQHLYTNVSVKLNDSVWKAKKDYQRAKVIMRNRKWEYDVLT